MKRVALLLLAVCMMASAFVLPVSAYSQPMQSGLWPSAWHADMNLTFDDSTAAPLNNLYYERSHNQDSEPEALPHVDSLIRRGVLSATNTARFSAKTRFVRNTISASQPDLVNHNLVSASGSTLDFGAKFTFLPKATDEIINIDGNGNFTTTGISANARGQLGRYLGFNINLHSMSDYINPDGSVKLHPSGTNKDKPYSTEYNISFVAYDNEKLNTNAAIIFISGSATGWSTWTGAVRNVYFCNLDMGRAAKYHRYTLTTDYAAGLNGEDMVTLYIDGEKATTFEAPAYRAYSATLGDSLSMGMYINGYCEENAQGNVDISVSMDQLSVYGTALTPAGAEMSTFNEEAPLYTDEFEDMVESVRLMDPTPYSKKSWQAVEDLLAEADALPPVAEMTKENVTQAELDAITQGLESALNALKYNDFNSVINEKHLYIPFSFFNASDPNGYAYAWTNSTLLFSDPNYDISQYIVNGSQLNDFLSIVFEPTSVAGQYQVKAVYPRGTSMAAREINKAPQDGFIIYSHNNIPGTSTSRYASQLFGDANAEVASQIKVGDLAILENVTLNPDSAATLVTNGTWRSRYDPLVQANMSEAVLIKYPIANPSWRDQFEDFDTLSTLVLQLPVGAYMDEYNEIMGKISAAVETDYTPDSWKAMQDVLAKIDMNDIASLKQDQIDEWTEMLIEAYEFLEPAELPGEEDEDADNPGASENTGDTSFVIITLTVIGFLAIACVAVLVIGRRRGNF